MNRWVQVKGFWPAKVGGAGREETPVLPREPSGALPVCPQGLSSALSSAASVQASCLLASWLPLTYRPVLPPSLRSEISYALPAHPNCSCQRETSTCSIAAPDS